MWLEKISLINFKSYTEAELSFSAKVNCFVGNNGVGKTNLLDAIYYLAFCKSFFNPIDSQNIKHEEGFFVIQGNYQKNDKEENLYCGIKRSEKKQFKRNKKAYKKLVDHIGLFPLVMISPADSELILGGSEIRRKFIDGVISQFDKDYLKSLLSYNKVLLQRNALLKRFAETRSFDSSSIEVWDDQLILHGNTLFEKRTEFIQKFVVLFQKYFDLISGKKESVSIQYTSDLSSDSFKNLLQDALKNDCRRQHTTKGIHKDDLTFKIEDHPIKKFGSQGQQKSLLLALKLAQLEYIKEANGVQPLLLLDDIFDKLDDNRVAALMQLVGKGDFGQIFITDTHESRVADILQQNDIEFRLFRINENNKIEQS